MIEAEKIKDFLRKLPFLGRFFQKTRLAESEVVTSARMTNNRLQALSGHGYRECYMEKIREVVTEQEPIETNKERWFASGQGEAPSNKARRTSTRLSQASITSTRLRAYQESIEHKNGQSSIDEHAQD